MRPAGAICLLVLLAWPRPAAAASVRSPERCRIAKIDAIAASTSRALRCWSQALRRGGASAAPACLAAAEAKLVRGFAHAEAVGACPPATGAAIDAISAYVAAQVEGTVPPVATVTPTPRVSPTVTASAAAGCGNGRVDAGEQCDGGPYCEVTCRFAFPSLCCAVGQQACIALADIAQADQCFLAGATPHIGASCVSPDPSCVPGQPCAGACEPATFAATRFCCDAAGSCTERTLSNTESLASFLLQCGAPALVEGSCTAGGCVPGG